MSRRNIESIFSWFFLALVLTGPGTSYAQSRDWRNRIDRVVEKADSLAMRSQLTFYLNKFLQKDRPVRETWHYTVNKGEVVIFEVHYFIDTIERLETYYLDREQVVCMEEYEILWPKHDDDRILWGTVCFFDAQQVRQYISMGAKTRGEQMPEVDPYMRFRRRFRELNETRTLLEKDDQYVTFAK
ncbi:MAG TPA: hypothetical protein PKJ36_06325 [Flavihumibacter sp.]|nr:hypothetical protein [Flavihumibacter sp.]